MMNGTVDCNKMWAPNYISLLSIFISVVFCLVITLGNVIIVIVVVIDPLETLRSTFSYVVINLAVADLIVGIISMPITIYFHALEYLENTSDALSLIKFSHMILFISLTASLLCLILFYIDRYVAVTFPLKYRSNLSWKRYWIASFMIWILSISFSLIYLKVGYIDFLMIYIKTTVLIAGITLVTTYIRIYKFLNAHYQRMKKITKTTSIQGKIMEAKKASQERKVTAVFLWILVLFLICYIPAIIIIYILQFYKTCNCDFLHIMRDASFYLITVNNCMNPFIHALKNKHCRDALSELRKRFRRIIYALVNVTTIRIADGFADTETNNKLEHFIQNG